MNELIGIIVGSEAVTVLVTALINAWQNRTSRLTKVETALADIKREQVKAEKDALRTQLLLLISDYPEETQEILTLGERYFGELHGNWYATSLFRRWLKKYNIDEPVWFGKEEK